MKKEYKRRLMNISDMLYTLQRENSTEHGDLQRAINRITKQLRCAAATKHSMRYYSMRPARTSSVSPLAVAAQRTGLGVIPAWSMSTSYSGTEAEFTFKCSKCGLEIVKTPAELNATETAALTKLKLL